MTEQNTISELQQKANDGDAQAQFELALCYAKGTKVEQDITTAIDCLKKSAEQGNANAQYAMGLSYFLRSYYFTDKNQTEEPYKLAQTLIQKRKVNNLLLIGDLVRSVFTHFAELVMTCDSGNDLAFMWFKKAAEQNNLEAIYWLGQCFRNGIGTEKNDVRALNYFRTAAEQGETESQFLLAYCFLEGKGIAQSNDLAFKWFKKAAEQGQIEAEYELYRCYFNGKAVEKSEAIALKLFVKADQQGYAGSWFKQASERGNTEDQFHFAYYYLYGRCVEKNHAKGMQWMIETAHQSNIEANYWLFNSYLALIIPAGLLDQAEAEACYDYLFNWCTKEAIGYDTIIANMLLGILYSTGKGVEQNDELAFEYFSKADVSWKNDVVIIPDVNHGGGSGDDTTDYTSLFLSNCYAQGKGVKKDLEKAKDHDLQYEQDICLQVMGQSFTDGEMKDIDGGQTNHRRTLLLLKLNILIFSKKYIWAKEFVNKIFENTHGMDASFKNICLETIKQNQELEVKNKELRLEIKEKEQLEKDLHKKENEMLSFFTHTMRNALATAPESLRQAISLLGGDVYEKDTNHYKAINKIAALFSTLSLTDCLIDTFKQSISDPQEFKQSWQMDHRGEATPEWVIASALRQALNRIIFMSDTTELRKLLNSQETSLVKMMRKSFIEEVLPLNVDKQGVDIFYEWSYKNIPSINVLISDTDKLHFGVNQTRFSLLFAITSELILNALKYWDGENRIQISWQLIEEKNYIFSVTNYCNKNASSNLAGTHKGLAFIKRLVELLGDQAEFKCRYEAQVFVAELILNKTLFNEEI